VVAILIVTFLLSALVLAQEPAAPATPSTTPTAPAAQQDSDIQENNQAPIEPVLSGPYPVMSKAAEDRGRQIFQMFNHSEGAQIYSNLTENLRKRIKTESSYVDFNKKLRERMGPETKMIEENIVPNIMVPDTIYTRLSYFERFPATMIRSVITINQRGQIDELLIGPVPTVTEGRFAGYTDTNKYHLPFGEEWLVYQGGRKFFDNIYALNDDQRYAVDFVYLKNGRMFAGKGGIESKNEDYYCFGQTILAPADGKVIKAESGYDDNPPGRPSGDPTDGNVVSISFGSGEIGTINHLKQNSLKVKIGDQVKQGQELAQCGNSGGGPIPHLHFQLTRGGGIPLPAQFVDYIADGKPVASGEPTRGEMVKNNPTAATASSTPATPPPAGK
jgi:Peptidase family M23